MNRFLRIAIYALALHIPTTLVAQDYFGGSRQSFRTNLHPKAKGLDLQIDFPRTWLIEGGKRPNVVVSATSQGGRGLENCNIVIRDLELDTGRKGYRPSKDDLAHVTSITGLKEEANASGIQFVKGAKTTLEGSPAGWFIGKQQGRAGLDGYFYMFVLQAFHDKWRVILTCIAGGRTDAEAMAVYQQNDAGFRLIANSVVIFSRWK